MQRFSKVSIRFSYSLVTFSVIVVCDVIVFIELLISHIFKGTLEIDHSEFVTLNKYVLKFDQLISLRHKTATWRRNEEFTHNGLNFCCNSRFSLNIIFLKEKSDVFVAMSDYFVKSESGHVMYSILIAVFKCLNHAKQIMSVPSRVYCNLLLSTWTGIKGLYYALFINE